jgi:hypothetical protein
MTADFQHRPPDGELIEIIGKGKRLITSGCIAIPDNSSVYRDADELEYSIDELSEILLEIFNTLNPHDFVGKHPSRRRDDPKVQGLEIYEFEKNCEKFNCIIYFKFSVDYEKFRLITFRKSRKI